MQSLIAAFDHADEALILVAAIGGVATVIVGVLNYASGKRGRASIERHVDTGNAKPAGETLHDVAQTVEAISGQVHVNTAQLATNAEELEQVNSELGRVNSRLAEGELRFDQMDERLDETHKIVKETAQAFNEWSLWVEPLRARAEEEWGPDGGKGKRKKG